jgi:hypothetical protein
MRTLVPLFLAAAASLATFALFAQAPGGRGPTNLKVLTKDNYKAAMPIFVASLGVADKGGCNFCHDPAQGAAKASDANPMKVKARMMIQMVMDINKEFGDGKDHVTCYTCHRGSTEPLMAAQ